MDCFCHNSSNIKDEDVDGYDDDDEEYTVREE
jgi:hypothetical protein